MGATMQTFVMTGVGEGSIRELDRFEPAPGEVVLRTRAAAICTTERRIFSGDVAIPFPVIGGHEVSGTVVEATDKGCGLKAGDRVVLDGVIRCGSASTASGETTTSATGATMRTAGVTGSSAAASQSS